MLNCYLFHSYSGNKNVGYRHIGHLKPRRRTPCRLTTTKTQLEAKNFTGLTGEQISGDLDLLPVSRTN